MFTNEMVDCILEGAGLIASAMAPTRYTGASRESMNVILISNSSGVDSALNYSPITQCKKCSKIKQVLKQLWRT